MRRTGCNGFTLAALGVLLWAGWWLSLAQTPEKFSATAIQIAKIESEEVKLPAEFQMALYENLIDEVRKTGKFQRIFRDGERGAQDLKDLVTLRSTVRGFKEGSARARQVTTVAGATSIKMRLQIAARDGRLLVDRDIEGKVRFFGENLRATHNLAKAVAKIISQTF
jgi:hypothetical protein